LSQHTAPKIFKLFKPTESTRIPGFYALDQIYRAWLKTREARVVACQSLMHKGKRKGKALLAREGEQRA